MHRTHRIAEISSRSVYSWNYRLLATLKISEHGVGMRTYLWIILDRVSTPLVAPSEETDRDPAEYTVNSLPSFWGAVTAYILPRKDRVLA